jgi:AraC-like DNA-binding protein
MKSRSRYRALLGAETSNMETDSSVSVEIRVGKLIADGYDDETIAERIGCSRWTVMTYRRQRGYTLLSPQKATVSPVLPSQRYCERCGAPLQRKRNACGSMESWVNFASRRVCGRVCEGVS